MLRTAQHRLLREGALSWAGLFEQAEGDLDPKDAAYRVV
jgi:hypothetical protein